jgi:hypothetical protein
MPHGLACGSYGRGNSKANSMEAFITGTVQILQDATPPQASRYMTQSFSSQWNLARPITILFFHSSRTLPV